MLLVPSRCPGKSGNGGGGGGDGGCGGDAGGCWQHPDVPQLDAIGPVPSHVHRPCCNTVKHPPP